LVAAELPVLLIFTATDVQSGISDQMLRFRQDFALGLIGDIFCSLDDHRGRPQESESYIQFE
jgi:hypothetical protein